VGASVAVSGAVLSTTGGAAATSPDVVISQVYGGGGNSGAPYSNDFIELFNRSTGPVTLTGWSVQYGSAAGTTWATTALSGTLAPGSYYLVQEAAGATPSTPLPTPDATGTLAMSGTAGKVALVTSTTALSCASADCATTAGVRDLIGYGPTANSFETAPTAALSNTTAAVRAGAGATDTDNNAADFAVTAPAPRSSGSGGGGSTPTPTPSDTPTPTPTATPTPTPPVAARIRDIQGAAHLSPLSGRAVTGVPGVVFALKSNGFWMQDPNPDARVDTSEGIFVFTGSAPTVAVQDSVTVAGTVAEFRPSGTATNLTTTEIGSPVVTVVAHGVALPAATVVGSGGRVPPSSVIDDDASGDVETSGTFDATTDGIDFWESLEGMRVTIKNAGVVGPTNSFGEFFVVPPGTSTPRSSRGGIVATAGDFNPERVMVADLLTPIPDVNVGDKLTGAVTGPLDYGFGNFELLPTSTPVIESGGLTAETTTAASTKQVAVASFNVENLAPSDPQAKFDGLAGALVNNLKSPDLVALEEIQDNTGATNDGVVAADATMAKLIAAVRTAGGPDYSWRSIDPVNDADGGQPGGNIRQVFMYRTDRGLAFVDRPGGTSTTPDSVVSTGGVPSLQYSPGRIDPASTAWSSSRKPLAGEFTFRGHTLFVIANHFLSKGGDNPLFGHLQPPSFPSETQRHQQATEVKNFVDAIRAVDADADVIVLGDLNDFDFSQTTSLLTAGGALVDLPATLPVKDRYTYVYEGNSEVLDHILLSPGLAATSYKYDVVHLNSEFSTQLSDHEPQVVRLPLP
jgi:predicted extracellular nuclease